MQNNFKISLSIKPKIGIIYDYMHKNKISLKQMSEILDVGYQWLWGVINFRYIPKTDEGPSTRKLLDYFGCQFKDIFPTTELKKIAGEYVLTREIPQENILSWGSDEMKQISYKHDFTKVDLEVDMEEALNALPQRDKDVLRLRYIENMELLEVGKELGITRERVRQIEARAFRRLKHPSRRKNLEGYRV
jgi:RNA polymerase sigma factor (sigma-70 family)